MMLSSWRQLASSSAAPWSSAFFSSSLRQRRSAHRTQRQEADKPPLVVSVPLSQLKLLYWGIAADIKTWPELSIEKGC